MKKMFLLFSHKLTKEQIKDAKTNLEVEEIIYLPESLQKLWSQVDPVLYQGEKLRKIWKFIDEKSKKEDYILIQGEWGWVYESVNYFLSKDMIPIYSTTERKIEEIYKENGEVEKKSFFKHKKYKKFLLI